MLESSTASKLPFSRLSVKPFGITVSRIAFGLPVGTDLEFADEITLAKEKGIKVYTIGLGSSIDEKNLKEISSPTDSPTNWASESCRTVPT